MAGIGRLGTVGSSAAQPRRDRCCICNRWSTEASALGPGSGDREVLTAKPVVADALLRELGCDRHKS